jgi:hypothetical protein
LFAAIRNNMKCYLESIMRSLVSGGAMGWYEPAAHLQIAENADDLFVGGTKEPAEPQKISTVSSGHVVPPLMWKYTTILDEIL